jgi:stage IV sporulation protein B
LILSLAILFSLVLSAGAFGIIDFITPDKITAFNIDELNKNNIILYSESEYNILDFLPSGLHNKSQAVFGVASSAEAEGNGYYSQAYYTAKLFGVIPIKKVEVNIFPETSLIPGGMPFGVKFFTEGVIVVGLSDIETDKGTVNPAKIAGVKTSDIITEINGSGVNSVEEAAQIIESSGGEVLSLKVQRDSRTLDIKLKPAYSVSEDKYKSGIWLRDSTAGIGTVTFISPVITHSADWVTGYAMLTRAILCR